MTLYRTVVADPPWPYESDQGFPTRRGTVPVGAARLYGVMSLDEIRAVPVLDAVEANAHLYLWTTNTFLEEAYSVVRAWGFAPKTVLTWVKTRQDDPSKPSMKTGYYFRGATEHVIFGVRGSLRTKGTAPTAFMHPRVKQHSAKPAAFFHQVTCWSPGPYLEIFSRVPRLGWDQWSDDRTVDVPRQAAP